ncbi:MULTISPECIES: DNA-processing protein DprA [unclassified Pseudoalteromonas]|uniref:DNA-processing protein DprA n=1 Tax=unclassified Pseudoalteromonas TaxID=194690 RepID=UPI001BB234DF|nr:MULTISPECIES: DNA-processing protein DprA [unclassified Pseudoalteromonas]
MEVSLFTFKLLCLSSLKGVGQQSLNRLLNEDILKLDLEEILKKVYLKKQYSLEDIEQARTFAQKQVDEAYKRGHYIISPLDNIYPEILKKLEVRPAILFIAGSLEAVNSKKVAVIGTREPTTHGNIIAKRITTWFTQEGWGILSGLAIGIDTIAHQSTLDANGITIAVLAHGLDTVYPAKNRGLADEILRSNGALVSEYPYGVTVRPAQLVQRDKIQAALSNAVVLVQSDLKGGSLHASREAIKLGRHLVVAGQSTTDLENNESKTQANNFILTGSNDEIARFMRCLPNQLDRIIYLKNKNDYSFVNNILLSVSEDVIQNPKEQSLFD